MSVYRAHGFTPHLQPTTELFWQATARHPLFHLHRIKEVTNSVFPKVSFRSRILGSLPSLPVCSVAVEEYAPPPSFYQTLYQLSSGLMAAVALLLLAYFPQYYTENLTVVSIVQRRKMSLGTQFGAASGFGIAAYLFFWLQQEPEKTWKHLPRLSRQVHVALILFCGLGLGAWPGEMGMLRLTVDALGSPSSHQLAVSSLGVILSTVARCVGLWTSVLGWKRSNAMVEGRWSAGDSIAASQGAGTEVQKDAKSIADELVEVQESVAHSLQNLDVPSDYHIARRISSVSKPHRKQSAPFYRNILLLLIGCTGSNMMEGIFRCRVSTQRCSRPWSYGRTVVYL